MNAVKITLLVWTFPAALPIHNYERAHERATGREIPPHWRPLVWMIEGRIMNKDYEGKTGYPSGQISIWVRDPGNYWEDMGRYFAGTVICPQGRVTRNDERCHSFSFRKVDGEKLTLTAMKFARDLFIQLGINVSNQTGPAMGQATLVPMRAHPNADEEWVDLGTKTWRQVNNVHV